MFFPYAANPVTKEVPDRHHFSSFWDKAGVIFSGLCLIDCVVLPALPLLLFGVEGILPQNINLHKFLLPAILLTATAAFYHSYRRHRAYRIVIPGICGVLLLVAGFLAEGAGIPLFARGLSLTGSALLIGAHTANLWQHRQHRCNLAAHIHEHSAQTP